MNYIIAGSRSIKEIPVNTEHLCRVMRNLPEDWPKPTKFICGCAPGPDRIGFFYARAIGIPVEFFPAWAFQSEWALYVAKKEEKIHGCPPASTGNRAGFIRNNWMALAARETTISTVPPFGFPQTIISPGGCVLLWDGISKGTVSMKEEAEKLGLKVFMETIKC